MAQESPSSVDVQNIQFKLHDKFMLFSAGAQQRSHVHLLAVSSSHGLLFGGNPNAAQLKVIILKELVEAKTNGARLRARVVPLPNVPNVIACSADGNMLAVNYTLNGSGFLHIFSVSSFTTPQIKSLFNIRLSSEDDVAALQLLWNPVLTNSLAVVLSNGSLGMYTLQEGGHFEMYSLDKGQQVRCGCWSPKGKQIVLGFPNGKLQQFKPDLTPAKTIACRAGVHPGPFDTIALHWLSTFQFAAVFLQQGDDMAPSLYIVNAAKGCLPTHINYYDICYSAIGPRAHQVSFTHIQPWNLLLVTSANGVEVGILGTKDSGDTPTWVQYTLLDEARIEMPLTEAKDETYPIGFAFDTSSSHCLIIGEKQMPVMPMVHVLSTHGHLVCFNFLNLSAGAVDVCSPPPPVTDTSGEFRALNGLIGSTFETKVEETQPTAAGGTPVDASFALVPNALTSTQAVKDQTTSQIDAIPQCANMFTQAAPGTFVAPTSKPTPVGFVSTQNNQFDAVSSALTPATTTFSSFGGLGHGSTPSFGSFTTKPAEISGTITNNLAPAPTIAQQKGSDLSKPLYTVPPTYAPPASGVIFTTTQMQNAALGQFETPKEPMESGEIDEIVKQMIAVQINAFDMELKQMRNQSKSLLTNIGNPDEMKAYTKRLNDLHEINEQANDRDFELDVQSLRHSLNDTYAMLAECRTKLELHNNPDISRLASISTFDPISRRQLAKLQSYLATNQVQLQQLQQQIDAQWSNYQDLVRRNSKSKMHIPCLDGIYQRLTKLKDLLSRQRTKLNHIRSKLKQKGMSYKAPDAVDYVGSSVMGETTIESLADSILSMSLSHIVEANRSKLSPEKLNAIRNFAHQQQEITIIRPHRPDRVGLRSEVILETKLQSERNVRENIAKAEQAEKQRIKSSAVISATDATKVQSHLAKPTATKPVVGAAQAQTLFAPPSQIQTLTPSFNFGVTSPFVKTSAAQPNARADELVAKSFAVASSAGSPFTVPNFAGFGHGAAPANLNFGPPKTTVGIPKAESTLREALAAPLAVQTPISFSAKIIGGDVTPMATMNKPFASSASPGAVATGFAALSANSASMPANKPSASAAAAAASLDKENKKPEDTSKQYSFFTPQEATAISAVSSFGPTTKSSLFDGKSSTGGAFSFGGGLSGTLSTNMSPFGLAAPGVAITTSTTKPATTASAPAPAFSLEGSVSLSTPNPILAGGITTAFEQSANRVTTTTATSAIPTTNIGVKIDALNLTTTTVNSAAPVTSPEIGTIATITNIKAVNSGTASTASTPIAAVPQTGGTSTGDATDTLFGTLNICKPTTQENAIAKSMVSNLLTGLGVSSSPFSFTAAAAQDSESDVTKSLFAATSTPGSTFSFASESSNFGKPLLASQTTTPVTTAHTTTNVTATAAPPVFSSVPAVSSPVSASVFGGSAASNSLFNTVAPATVDAVTSAATTPAIGGTAASSIFGGGASFLNAPPTTTAPSSMPPLFGGVVSSAPTTNSSAPLFAVVATSSATSGTLFGSTVSATPAATTGNIFGGIPKPDQSVFGSTTAPATAAGQQVSSAGGIFAAAAAANPSPFSSPSATGNAGSGGSIFAGGATAFGSNAAIGGSIFGGSSSAATSPFAAAAGNTATGSIFGGGAAKPIESASIFGSPTQPASGGSLFGQSSFGQTIPSSGGNLFSAGAGVSQQSATPGFGSGGSIFGGTAANNVVTGGSIFGGGDGSNSAFGAATTRGFGAFSQPPAVPFGSPNSSGAGGGGSFAQGGASVAQSGFGSPQQASAFAKPVFGGASAFGNTSAFGGQPSFGGAPTFGSPKGFGSFATPAAAPAGAGAFGSPTQKNNLFEALGSTDSGLSFGNLAQASNANASQPAFGGSSFMNYRA